MGVELLLIGGALWLNERMKVSEYNRKAEAARVEENSYLRFCTSFDDEREIEGMIRYKNSEVWDKIESFKRDNPHLVIDRKGWDIVGKKRFSTSEAEKTAALYYRVCGYLSRSEARAMTSYAYYGKWVTTPFELHGCLGFKCNMGKRQAEVMKEYYTSTLVKEIEMLPGVVREAVNEQHDAIVYMIGTEFDPSCEEAVTYVVERLKEKMGLTYKTYDELPCGVSAIISDQQYKEFVASGGEEDTDLAKRIGYRENKEQEANARGFLSPSYVPEYRKLAVIMRELMWSAVAIMRMEARINEITTAEAEQAQKKRDSRRGFLLVTTVVTAVSVAIYFLCKLCGY